MTPEELERKRNMPWDFSCNGCLTRYTTTINDHAVNPFCADCKAQRDKDPILFDYMLRLIEIRIEKHYMDYKHEHEEY